eukprot:CAMPEP_0197257496 /NCGR_PEP_ID=MMETSP1429-20130617/78888_1 /TAXON_ID=49237 /ORGANISM="Chaetoceros  sp., Strain UNC1202" /LENGTH=55 /DNA_ID=CAMNT_0042721349 /DNA_START=110 /DNA_END=273 /DNA_ORIENTATION=+
MITVELLGGTMVVLVKDLTEMLVHVQEEMEMMMGGFFLNVWFLLEDAQDTPLTWP